MTVTRRIGDSRPDKRVERQRVWSIERWMQARGRGREKGSDQSLFMLSHRSSNMDILAVGYNTGNDMVIRNI